ncbi:hypothetical protein [Paenibacillus sp. J22TS3]|uniref:hypothetical protein n=1 Tax=Paenibacillus sp. J22TS3 TaxID=2807192 RepID=UPI001B281F74|nr:hypothetical protein [Paenibacillus sp. J22TS3]GIP21986.1 hypothetical protein J22TS3_22610 [Paenibacillus sp. J22TS3]
MDFRKTYAFARLHRSSLLLAFLFLAAVFLRYAYVFLAGSPNFLGGDGQRYYTMVQQIITEHSYGYGSETSNSRVTPGFPVYASTVLAIFSMNLNAFKWVQIMLGAATIFPLYAFLRSVPAARPWLTWSACAFMVIYPPFIYMTGLFYTETLFFFLLVSFFASWQIMWRSGSVRSVVLSAVLLSFAILTRPVMTPVLLIVIVFLACNQAKRRLLVPLLLTVFLCFLPWVLRNWLVLHEFTLLAKDSGNALLAGAYPYFYKDVDYNELEHKFGNDQTRYGIYLIMNGFRDHFLSYFKWFTYGKLKYLFKEMWFHNREYFPVLQVKISAALHYLIIAISLVTIPYGLIRKQFLAWAIAGMLAFQLLFIPTSRYGTPFILLMLMLICSSGIPLRRWQLRKAPSMQEPAADSVRTSSSTSNTSSTNNTGNTGSSTGSKQSSV